MPEYIEREALLDRMTSLIKRITPIEENRDMFYHDSGRNGAIAGVLLEVENAPAADMAPVVHGRWIYEAHKEHVNCRWNVTAECSECRDERKEIWAGFFPGVPDCIAKEVALQGAKQGKLSNYCPNCGAKMDAKGGEG